jgi:c(7)-type cytochrome triheme protein
MGKKYLHLGILFFLSAFLVLGLTVVQAPGQKKVGGGDIVFKPKNAAPVLFSHAYHVNTQKFKCTDCHTKIFKMKKEDLKMTKETHGQDKYCGVCHNGKKKAFSMTAEADCAKCHKK